MKVTSLSSTWFSPQSARRNASKGGEAACEGDSGDKTPIRRRSLALLPMCSERPRRRPADRSDKQPTWRQTNKNMGIQITDAILTICCLLIVS
jgi:hypothetical protein